MEPNIDQNWIKHNANAAIIIENRKLKKKISELIGESKTNLMDNCVSNLDSKYSEPSKQNPIQIEWNIELQPNVRQNMLNIINSNENILALKQEISLKSDAIAKSSSMSAQNQLLDELRTNVDHMNKHTEQLVNKMEMLDKTNGDLMDEKRTLIESNVDLEKQLNEKQNRIKMIIVAKSRSDTKLDKLENIISLLKYQIRELGEIPWTERKPIDGNVLQTDDTSSVDSSSQSNSSQRYAFRDRNKVDSKMDKKENYSENRKRKLSDHSKRASVSVMAKTSKKSIEFDFPK